MNINIVLIIALSILGLCLIIIFSKIIFKSLVNIAYALYSIVILIIDIFSLPIKAIKKRQSNK